MELEVQNTEVNLSHSMVKNEKWIQLKHIDGDIFI